ncbi:hypothetical protein QL285_022018 [Trifolium repens]|nr:hypothetical protein QL285_022018 [Trifolium repens]
MNVTFAAEAGATAIAKADSAAEVGVANVVKFSHRGVGSYDPTSSSRSNELRTYSGSFFGVSVVRFSHQGVGSYDPMAYPSTPLTTMKAPSLLDRAVAVMNIAGG